MERGEKKPATPTNLIVLLAFIRDEKGELRPAFEPREMQSEDKAKMDAKRMAALGTYEGVIAWYRTADLVNGVFGDPVTIFQRCSRSEHDAQPPSGGKPHNR